MHGARPVAPSPPRAALSTPGPWIESARFDVPLFLLSPLLGLALLLVAPSGAHLVALVAGTLVGVPHYLSTFTFYFWRENRAYHRGRWLAFYAGPVLIAGLFALAVGARAFAVLQ